MERLERLCAFCGREISIGEAWMLSERGETERVAHSGCVYSEEDPEERAWWMPPETEAGE